jgi:flagellar motility protein MotE (MotC chaperone)
MMFGRLKLLPVTIVAALLLLAIKVADVWHGADAILASARAQNSSGANGASVAGGAQGSAMSPDASGKPDQPADVAAGGPSDGTPVQAELPEFNLTDITPEDIELLETLAKRREQLDARGRELDMREKILAAAEVRVDGKVEELKHLQEIVEALIVKLDNDEETNIKSLVKIYEQMRPKDAARIFDQLDMAVLLGVVDRMREAKAAAIMGKMDSDKAKSLTTLLAQRRELSEAAKKSDQPRPQ